MFPVILNVPGRRDDPRKLKVHEPSEGSVKLKGVKT
jgi:hypothetical protein